jgi:ERCC4-type nuclease
MKQQQQQQQQRQVVIPVIIDTREQAPVLYDCAGAPGYEDLQIETGTLRTGDYSISGMESPSCRHSITIERKSLPDLFGSTGRGRDRFERECIRMMEYDHAEIVVEADLATIFSTPPPASSMLPKSVYRTILAFSQRYKIQAWWCPNRQFAERHIYLTLKRFYTDRLPGGKMEFCKI